MATDIIIQIVQPPPVTANIEIVLGSQVTWNSVVNKPTLFPPATHVHSILDISGLQTVLDGKAPLIHVHSISDTSGLQAALNGKAASVHTHAISDVTNLQTSLDGKAATSHTHAITDVTGLQVALDGKAATSHTHIIANVMGLQTALDGKQVSGSYAAAVHTHVIADITGLQTTIDQRGIPVGGTAGQVLSKVDGSNYNVTWTAPTGGSVAWADITGKPSTFPPSAHSHVIADVTGLQSSLDGKAASSHTHVIADITGLQSTIDQRGIPTGGTTGQVLAKVNGTNYNVTWITPTGGSVAWADITGKPSTFTPSAHTHVIADVTNLQTVLDGKAPSVHTHAIADVTGLQTALDGKAPSVHTHAIADVTGLQTVLDATNGTALNQATIKLVRKASAGTITKGQVVYIVGSQGTHLTVELADADAEATAATTIGVAMGNITSTVEGYIIVQGYLDGLSNLPTATFTNGQALWLSSTAGAWTNTRPTQPAHGVFIGWVVSASNGASGRAYIKVINGQELDELHDVLITSPSEGQVLTYEAASGVWKNQTPSGITNGKSIANALIFG